MSLWNRIRGLVEQDAHHYTYRFIDEAGGGALRANESYFRLWLTEMFLARGRQWGTDQFPSVATAVQLRFGDHSAVSLTHVAQAPTDALSRAVTLNYPATPLLPFRGGVVEVEGALVALQGGNQLRAAIGALGEFAAMIAPPVAQALEIAGKVADGVDKVLDAGQSPVHLGLHDAFADAGGGGHNVLRPGYLAVVLATRQQLDPDSLSVVEGRLHRARNGDSIPLDGHDYMVYRIEGRQTRDDWRLRDIEQPMNQAVEALLKGEKESGEAYRRVALIAALTSPDLTVPDRRRVAQAIKAEIQEVEDLGLGAAPPERRDLGAMVNAHAVDVDVARSQPPMTLEEALGT